MITPQNAELLPHLRDEYDRNSLARLRTLLDERGTLTFPRLSTGLFSASVTTDYSKGTNYHAAWVRDNVHIAYAHLVNGKPEAAVAVARALAVFFATQRTRFEQIIADPSRKAEAMQRPHVRFDGESLTELPQTWAHAQNDALGYFVWLYATVVLHGLIPREEWDVTTLSLFPPYFQAIQYSNDEDSGHWEEVRKISASSIGTVVAGLRVLREWIRRSEGVWPASLDAECKSLIDQGEEALARILPAECDQAKPGNYREADSALLFLIYPLQVVPEEMAERIVSRTVTILRGPVGIKRYRDDSFYCRNYESLMAQRADDPTRDFSQDIQSRDALVSEGGEAQWCLFDPLLSVYYGYRYQISRDPDDLRKQTDYLNRSLAQITRAAPPRCEAFRCPELYYVEQGQLQTSKSTPLLWTQANLWNALETMRRTLELD